MYSPLGQFPYQPGLDCSEKKIATLRLLPRSRYVIQDPFDLRSGKISIYHKTGFLAKTLSKTFGFEGITVLGGSATLPDDRMIDRIPGVLVPDNCGLTLVGDADCSNVGGFRADHIHGFYCYSKHACPDLIRVMLHPARLWEVLVKFTLCYAAHFTFFVE